MKRVFLSLLLLPLLATAGTHGTYSGGGTSTATRPSPDDYGLTFLPMWEIWALGGAYDEDGSNYDGVVNAVDDYIRKTPATIYDIETTREAWSGSHGIRIGDDPDDQLEWCRDSTDTTEAPLYEPIGDNTGTSVLLLDATENRIMGVVKTETDTFFDNEYSFRAYKVGMYDGCDGVGGGDVTNSMAIPFRVDNTSTFQRFSQDGTHIYTYGSALVGQRLLHFDKKEIYPRGDVVNLVVNGTTDDGDCTTAWEIVPGDADGTPSIPSHYYDPQDDDGTYPGGIIGYGCNIRGVDTNGKVRSRTIPNSVRAGDRVVFELYAKLHTTASYEAQVIDQDGNILTEDVTYSIDAGGFLTEDPDGNGLYEAWNIQGSHRLRVEVVAETGDTSLRLQIDSGLFDGGSSTDIFVDHAFGKIVESAGPDYYFADSALPAKIAWISASMGRATSNTIGAAGAMSRMQGNSCHLPGASDGTVSPVRATKMRPGLTLDPPCLGDADNFQGVSGRKFIDTDTRDLMWDEYFQWAVDKEVQYIIFWGHLNDIVSGSSEATPLMVYNALMELDAKAKNYRIKALWIPLFPTRSHTTSFHSRMNASDVPGNTHNTGAVGNAIIQAWINETPPPE